MQRHAYSASTEQDLMCDALYERMLSFDESIPFDRDDLVDSLAIHGISSYEMILYMDSGALDYVAENAIRNQLPNAA